MIVAPGRWSALIWIQDDDRTSGANAQAFVDRLSALVGATGGRVGLVPEPRNPRAEFWRIPGVFSDDYALSGRLDFDVASAFWSRELADMVARSWRESGAGGHISQEAYARELDADEHDAGPRRIRLRAWTEASSSAPLERPPDQAAILYGDGWRRPPGAPPPSRAPGPTPRPPAPPRPGSPFPATGFAVGAVGVLAGAAAAGAAFARWRRRGGRGERPSDLARWMRAAGPS